MWRSPSPASPWWSDEKSPSRQSSTEQNEALSTEQSGEPLDDSRTLGAGPGAVSAAVDAAVSGGTPQLTMPTKSQDTMLIDERIMEQMSYMDLAVQKWALRQLLRNERGLPGVAVFDRSLSYTENVKRKPSGEKGKHAFNWLC